MDKHAIRVMSFNVRGSFRDARKKNAWRNRATLNVATIERYAPDVIGLQEAQRGNLSAYRKRLPRYARGKTGLVTRAIPSSGERLPGRSGSPPRSAKTSIICACDQPETVPKLGWVDMMLDDVDPASPAVQQRVQQVWRKADRMTGLAAIDGTYDVVARKRVRHRPGHRLGAVRDRLGVERHDLGGDADRLPPDIGVEGPGRLARGLDMLAR